MHKLVFISYRRQDSSGYCNEIAAYLELKLGRLRTGESRVFRDLEGIRGGEDFNKVILQKIAQSGVMLVLIGPLWLDSFVRALNDDVDYVKMEILAALDQGLPVIPVLLGTTPYPDIKNCGHLPEDVQSLLKHLNRSNYVEYRDRDAHRHLAQKEILELVRSKLELPARPNFKARLALSLAALAVVVPTILLANWSPAPSPISIVTSTPTTIELTLPENQGTQNSHVTHSEVFGIKLITQFEEFHGKATLDHVGIPFIGYGTTKYKDGRPVKLGDEITERDALEEIRWEILSRIRPKISTIPGFDQMDPRMVGALDSFAFNLGSDFYRSDNFKTITSQLHNRDWKNMRQTFIIYRNPDTDIEAGLLSRRMAEADLWDEGVRRLGKILPVTYYNQRDNTTLHAQRMSLSSCNAMLLNYLKPGSLNAQNGDEQFLTRVLEFGDTTQPEANIKALQSYGIDASFRQNLDWPDVDTQLDLDLPVPIGILQHGHVSNPTGTGHFILIIGRTEDGQDYWVHDPYGRLDLSNGNYLNQNGDRIRYNKNLLTLRWQVEGHKTGWGVIAKPKPR